MATDVEHATGRRIDPREIAQGFLAIAVDNVANAIKQISIARGYDVTTYTLVCFGGAGGQHACLVADALGMTRVLIHPLAGVLSAYGIGLADERLLLQRAIEETLRPALLPQLESAFAEIEMGGRSSLLAQGITAGVIRAERRLNLKYKGTDTSLEIDFAPEQILRTQFETSYRQRFAFVVPDAELVVESITLELIASPNMHGTQSAQPSSATDAAGDAAIPTQPVERVRTFMAGGNRDTPVFDRDPLRPGARIAGPAILFDRTSTTVIEPGWAATVSPNGDLVLERTHPLPARTAPGTDADPVMLEIFNNLFMSIAEQMGVALQSTAHSVNIKERLDFSCALFDTDGALIANAPHMPVHLGSMG